MIILYITFFIISAWLIPHASHIATLTQQRGRNIVPVSQSPDNPIAQILVTGDSTAVGVGALSPECSLVGRLAQDLPTVLIENIASNSMRLSQLHTQLNRLRSMGTSYDYVLIHIGGIDTVSLTPLPRIESNLRKVITLAKSITRHHVIIVSVNNTGLIPLFSFPVNYFLTRRSRKVSKIFSDVCTSTQTVHIPLFAEKEQDELCKNPAQYISPDGIHPNDMGYGLWYKKIRTTTLPLITRQTL